MTTISIPFLDLENSSSAKASPAIAFAKEPAPLLQRSVSDQTQLKNNATDQRSCYGNPVEITLPTKSLRDMLLQPQTTGLRLLEISNDPSRKFDHSPRPRTVNQKASDSSADKLVESILERFPLAAPTILLFVGTEANRHTSLTCGLVASALASRKIGDILLVDSSSKNELTHNHSLNDQRGLSNLLAHCEDWSSTVHKLSTSGLDLMPAGTTHWQHWGAEANLRKLSAEFKRKYQFVCVSAGDALHSNPRLWASVSDGTYLLVSLKNANQDIAQSSVAELQSNGARLLGCIVTDTELAS